MSPTVATKVAAENGAHPCTLISRLTSAESNRRASEPALERLDLAVEEVDLAQTAGHGLALIGGQLKASSHCPTTDPETLAHRRAALEVSGEHRVQLVLCPGAWRTSAARRASRRRIIGVLPSGPKTSGRRPPAARRASGRRPAAVTFASAIARTLRVFAITTRPTWGSSTRAHPERRAARLERHLVVRRQALSEQLQLLGAGLDAPGRAHLAAVLDNHPL